MTEYDYSPEAYNRYLATQTRIANWVDDMEHHRPAFEHAVGPAPASAPTHPQQSSKLRKAPPPPPTMPRQMYQPMQMQQQRVSSGGSYAYAQPRAVYMHPPPESVSSDEYGVGPGPMPMMYAPQAYAPMAPPHPLVQYMQYAAAKPRRRSSHSHSHSSSHSHSHSRGHGRHSSSGYYTVASPPVSPGFQQYGGGYPPQQQMGRPGYFVMPQQRPMMYH